LWGARTFAELNYSVQGRGRRKSAMRAAAAKAHFCTIGNGRRKYGLTVPKVPDWRKGEVLGLGGTMNSSSNK